MGAKEGLLFLSSWLRSPRQVGAIAPSSSSLGKVVARQISPEWHGPVVELGGGTGSITRCLLAHGISPGKLIVIERDPAFCKSLKVNFPGVSVVEGDAQDSSKIVEQLGAGKASSYVSGLPLLNMPEAVRYKIFESAFACMRDDGVFIQFTYAPVCPVPEKMLNDLGLTGKTVNIVPFNLPPAAVWRFTRKN